MSSRSPSREGTGAAHALDPPPRTRRRKLRLPCDGCSSRGGAGDGRAATRRRVNALRCERAELSGELKLSALAVAESTGLCGRLPRQRSPTILGVFLNRCGE